MLNSERLDWEKTGGLMPAIVQDAFDGRVLMQGYMNPEALARTQEIGQVTFWSRSRETLWTKGETSGNALALVDIRADCDADCLLVRAAPAGPTCHTGATSCFSAEGDTSPQGFARLEALWSVIADRAAERPPTGYTTTLLDGGVDVAGRKVVEEATEVLLAAKDHAAGSGSSERIAEETADLVYHLLVLLAERGMQPSALLDELDSRAS